MQTWLIHLDRGQCEELLATAVLGRLAVIVDGRPEIFPISHVYDRQTGCVAFPTNRGTKLDHALEWPSVAFEVDGVDQDGTGGWSVLVVGAAEEISDAQECSRLAAQRRALWRTGDCTPWVRIVPSKITGRRISATD